MGARLLTWDARALYLGPAYGLSAHRNAVAVLCVGLQEPFGVARDPTDSAAGTRTCRTAMIPHNTFHRLETPKSDMAFLYVDPMSRDLAALMARMTERDPGAAYDLTNEQTVLATLNDLAADRAGGIGELADLLGLSMPGAPDRRVARALDRMRETPDSANSLEALAMAAGLSSSRFRHLFKATTGLPLRRYRLWTRMFAAIQAAEGGATLTEAALASGFASSAHFSAAFRGMFGLSATQLGRVRLQVDL